MELFLQNRFIVDVRLGSKYASSIDGIDGIQRRI